MLVSEFGPGKSSAVVRLEKIDMSRRFPRPVSRVMRGAGFGAVFDRIPGGHGVHRRFSSGTRVRPAFGVAFGHAF